MTPKGENFDDFPGDFFTAAKGCDAAVTFTGANFEISMLDGEYILTGMINGILRRHHRSMPPKRGV